MIVIRSALGRFCWRHSVRAVAVAVTTVLAGVTAAKASPEFPFDRELLLEAKRIGTVKRMPILLIAPNGEATIDLWCKTVTARVEVGDGAIRVEPAPLPEAMPAMMSHGQCSPERMQADQDLIAALAQATQWHASGEGIVLSGPVSLKFRLSTH